MEILEQFTLVWCDACGKTQPMIFDVIRADDTSDHAFGRWMNPAG
jgi:hypothetical protein